MYFALFAESLVKMAAPPPQKKIDSGKATSLPPGDENVFRNITPIKVAAWNARRSALFFSPAN